MKHDSREPTNRATYRLDIPVNGCGHVADRSWKSILSIAILGLELAFLPACNRSAAGKVADHTSDDVAVHVETQPIAERGVPVWLSLTGQLKGSRETDLAANANGRITKTLVERGDMVKAGHPLAVLDTR